MKKKPSKSNLFRFVTLRNPQLIAEEKKDQGFVFFPDTLYSQFMTALDGKDQATQKVVMDLSVAEAPPLSTKKEVRDQNENLYRFSSWLMRNKNQLTYVEIKTAIAGVAPLTDEKEIKIWDNLVYQTIERTSTYVREATIQMLIANKFVKAFLEFSKDLVGDIVFTEDQEKEFTRRAHASVVISKSMYNVDVKETSKKKRVSKRVQEATENEVKTVLAKERIASYEKVIKELDAAELVIKKENQEAYDAALSTYNKGVDTLIKNATAVVKEEVNTVTGRTETKTTYPDLVIPEFEFDRKPETEESVISSKISGTSFDVLKSDGLLEHGTIAKVKEVLVDTIARENEFVIMQTPKKAKQVKIGGSVVTVSNKINVPDADYSMPPLHQTNSSGERDINMHIYRQLDGVQIIYVEYEVLINNITTLSGTEFTVSDTPSGKLLKFFPSLVAFPPNTTSFMLEGEIVLSDGRSLTFNQQVFSTSLNLGDFHETTNTGTVPVSDRKVYGVTNLGIADFRRVEQEVCCYVPGEVSHIENILAREYKERSTRNLTSVETTTEETTEREVENLRDTSTTERFEIQSEASSIVNEDSAQDAGANAGVSGMFGGTRFNANAFFNTSSSSSTSNSNSEAQTYAEEVTERALERVVEKVTRKRTSRILKEFEENNKHGFDNTQGTEHVTGVYRWVDKIYTNKLVNYGKRLMYEFAIPEPSRFFKEAIALQATSGTVNPNTTVLPEEPQHPSEIGMIAPTVVLAGNYKAFAGAYNAEVNAMPQQFMSVSDSFSVKGTEYLAEHYYPGASNFKMEIPDGYEVISAQATLGFTFVPHGKESTYGAMTVGHHYTSLPNASNDKIVRNYSFSSNPIQKELGVAFHGADVGGASIGVVANCRRTSEIFEQWQLETFNAIMDVYENQLQAYNDALAAVVTPVEEDPGNVSFNPLFNRSVEKKEIKRIAIELLADQLGQTIAKENYEDVDGLTGISKVVKNNAFDTHASTVKFFEQAFDWDIMAYLFYPYFYGEEENWKSLFQENDAADPIFQAFLQSGMARAVVPVRPGFEEAVNWYMETGELWEGQGLVIAEDNDLYLSISEEMQIIEGEVEKEWETRVPTSLTIVQADAAVLQEEGLPCYCENEERDSTIERGTAILTGTQNTPEPTTLTEIEPVSQSDIILNPIPFPEREGGDQITF
ncbi:hypothetical protein [uncultured Dokdonia sp.]|uniref:hypothetical protein n=1 Tax=uncultured Dokdonia sp. TaxID=575653 RepID=UPI00262C5DAC|nr:hypothetical protein [uncultured Dokdonia sp.]